MNRATKWTSAVILILILGYGAWLVVETTIPVGDWFQQNPEWRFIFNLLILVGGMGFLAALVEAKRK